MSVCFIIIVIIIYTDFALTTACSNISIMMDDCVEKMSNKGLCNTFLWTRALGARKSRLLG